MKKLLTLLIVLSMALGVSAQKSERIWKLYRDGKKLKALELAIALQKKFPNDGDLNLSLGELYISKKEYAKAAPFLQKSIHKNNSKWVRAWGIYNIGYCMMVDGEMEKAKACWEKCLKVKSMNRLNEKAKMALEIFQMDDYFSDWEILESKHIRFHFQDKSKLNYKWFMESRENAFIELNQFFVAMPYKKIDFFVWAKPDDAQKKYNRSLGWAHGKACVINSRSNQTKGHELCHVLCQQAFRTRIKRTLINEGVAVYFDLNKTDKIKVAQQSLKGKKVNIEELWEDPEKYPKSYNYEIGGALIDFLLQKGSEKQLKALLKNQSIESAQKIYPNLKSLLAEFEELLVCEA